MPDYQLNGQSVSLHFPAVMGIVNLTPDSFSDGGQFLSPEDAVTHARHMLEQGAQIIDLGGESTRPGSEPVSEQDELARVLPVIESLLKEDFVISLDTTKPAVALAGLQAGISILNDVSGGNQEMLEHASRFQAGYVVMHTQGSPQTMQDSPKYDDVVEEVRAFFDAKAEDLQALELPRLWIDPGIGFGKTLEHNLALMRELDELIDPRWGILLGSSRKSWIDHLCHAPDPLDRLGGSLCSALAGVARGAEIIRAHDVRETVQALEVAKGLALIDPTE
ncbi:dihydropteroate synthase [Opitutales bacterium]|nr:dihydropteroate synthase [Opitutales bacterium]